MVATELMKLCEAYVAGQAGEEIEYLPYPSGVWLRMTVPVDRQPVDGFGSALVNRIHVFIPKTLLGAVQLQKDYIRLAPVAVGETNRKYLVTRSMPGGQGHYWLECTE